MDYVGIVALIFGSFVPSVYYGFYCEPMLQKTYWGMVGFQGGYTLPTSHILNARNQISTIAIACTIVSVNPKFRTPLWRPFRASMFVGFGLSAVFPVLHGVRIYGANSMQYSMGLYWIILQGFLYILGAALYAVRPSLHRLIAPGCRADFVTGRHGYRKGSGLGGLMFGGARTKSSTSLYSWQRCRILWAF